MPVDEYLQELDNPQIKEWIEGCSSDGSKAYVLKHEITEVEYPLDINDSFS